MNGLYPVTKDFIGKPAPPGYVAGLGRGATGFTTRLDIGPARTDDSGDTRRRRANEEAEEEGRMAKAENEEGLFSNMRYEDDDEEADKVWAMIDSKMEERRRGKHKNKELEDTDQAEIEGQLQGLKRQLGGLSAEEWDSIPEVSQVAESAARAKRRRKQAAGTRGGLLAPVSDSTLMAGLGMSGYDQEISASTPADAQDGGVTNLLDLGRARDSVLRLKLDQAGDSASGGTTVDPQGYLTSLRTQAAGGVALGDVDRARTLLRSVTRANPKHVAAWVAAARVEEAAGKVGRARAVIAQGCENCAQSEDVWLEAARLGPKEAARKALASAARHVPRSVRVWMAAADVEEGDEAAQRRILRRALERVPTSATLWKAAVALEGPEDARALLAHAVELVPLSTELWLALARLEPHAQAQKVLNRARRAIPTSHDVWLAAARLEEQSGGGAARVDRIMAKAVPSLAHAGAAMDRDAWLDQAHQCERDGCVLTCRAVVSAAANMGFSDADGPKVRASAWADAAEQRATAGGLETARALFEQAEAATPADAGIWRRAAEIERVYAKPEDAERVLRRAVECCPASEELWLMAAHERGARSGDVAGARAILEEAMAANPQSEAIVLAAVRLESDSGEYDRALALLERARTASSASARVWLKSAVLLRQLGRNADALELARSAVVRFPQSYKLWLVVAQLEPPADARRTLSRALKACPGEPTLWVYAAELSDALPRARAILERARVHIPKSPALWLASIRLEPEDHVARSVLARALQECPQSGALWAEALVREPRAQRKARAADALRAADAHDPALATAVARLFWADRRRDKARTWFRRATAANPHYGDAWAWWLRFEQSAEDSDEKKSALADLEAACKRAAPTHGDVWARVAKDPANARLSANDVLYKVAERLEDARQLS
ncbi:U4/U6 x U5 tri-snRNP complex subunit Prp1 [Coemansia sp. RSA 552]|nr:U4/U6 x U5 tri-snRNP complex subunit Prp1 [Coemansia sp. RSA 552]